MLLPESYEVSPALVGALKTLPGVTHVQQV